MPLCMGRSLVTFKCNTQNTARNSGLVPKKRAGQKLESIIVSIVSSNAIEKKRRKEVFP